MTWKNIKPIMPDTWGGITITEKIKLKNELQKNRKAKPPNERKENFMSGRVLSCWCSMSPSGLANQSFGR